MDFVIAAGPPSPELPVWVLPTVTVMAALIGAAGLIIVRVIRGPVAVQDLWAENRQLRNELNAVDNRLDAATRGQIVVNKIMGEGFDALLHVVERLQVGGSAQFTERERQAVLHASELRNSDDWPNPDEDSVEDAKKKAREKLARTGD